VSASFLLGFLALALAPQDAPPAPPSATSEASTPPAPRGLVRNEPGSFAGYTFVAPLKSKTIRLIDMAGEVVHSWAIEMPSGADNYFLANGHLLHCLRDESNPVFHAGGVGGHLREYDWDGNLVWSYTLMDEQRTQHHDIEPLPNGNVLLITYERWSKEEAIARGRDPEVLDDEGLWPDAILEIEPVRPVGGKVVWEWHVTDHLIQDADPDKPDYGSIPNHPGRLDLNGDHRAEVAMTLEEQRTHEATLREMAALGYAGDDEEPAAEDSALAERKKRHSGPDWLHTNGIAYHAGYDLIAISSPEMCEVYVIDHSTTSAEAAGESGGRWGRGGEFLWRWGNPRNYGHGGAADQRLFYQHHPTWVAGARPGELRLLLFNNGGGRQGGDFSSVEELVLPFDPERGFLREEGKPFGPAAPAWSYSDPPQFFAAFISGAQRLPNGNTLVCEGPDGRVFEVTPRGEIVWEYLNPFEPELAETKVGGNAPPYALFRATRVPADHPGLAGKGLLDR